MCREGAFHSYSFIYLANAWPMAVPIAWQSTVAPETDIHISALAGDDRAHVLGELLVSDEHAVAAAR